MRCSWPSVRGFCSVVVAASLDLACSDSGSRLLAESNTPNDPGDGVAPAVDCSNLLVEGDPVATSGARFGYASTDGGIEYQLEGLLFQPQGTGPFPAVLVSHGKDGAPQSYSANVARVMVPWGVVVMAPRYTHAADPDGRNALLLPAGADGASDANVLRAGAAIQLLSCLDWVDTTRLAAHGHSMGAFVTGEVMGTFSSVFMAASHSAGGTSTGPNATRPATLELITTPYQIHHGDADAVVRIELDMAFEQALSDNAIPHEFHRYLGYTHEQMALDPTMLDRIHTWYTAQSLFGAP